MPNGFHDPDTTRLDRHVSTVSGLFCVDIYNLLSRRVWAGDSA